MQPDCGGFIPWASQRSFDARGKHQLLVQLLPVREDDATDQCALLLRQAPIVPLGKDLLVMQFEERPHLVLRKQWLYDLTSIGDVDVN